MDFSSSTSFLVFHSIYVHIGLLKKFVELVIGAFWIWEFYLNLVLKYPNISMKYLLHSIFFSLLLGLLLGKIWTAGPIFHVSLGFCAKLRGELSSSKFQLTNAVFSWVLSSLQPGSQVFTCHSFSFPWIVFTTPCFCIIDKEHSTISLWWYL